MSVPSVLPALALLFAVVLVNGWTDAPNAIATPVASGALPFPLAAALAAVCNLLGMVTVTAVNQEVARTLYSLADLSGGAAVALTAALGVTALWGLLAWQFGIPTSESHALIAGLAGSALAMGAHRLRWGVFGRVGLGLVLSLAVGWALGMLFRALLPRKAKRLYRDCQILGLALIAYLHGAQDGQKFLGMLALVLTLGGSFSVPLWAGWAVAGTMALGTLLGGRRIIETVGEKMVSLDPRSGFAADLGCALTLTLCTLLGLPVSTTHAKAAAILGAGNSPDGRVAGELALAWLLTFPGCGMLAWGLVKLTLLW